MNRIQRIAFLLAIIVGMVITGCQKETSLETGNGGPLGPTAWAFKEGSNSFKGPIDTAYYMNTGGVNALALEGRSTDLKDDLYLEILGANIATGAYGTPSVVFEYYTNGKLLYSNDPLAANKFTVTITKINATEVAGIFSGEVKDSSGNIKTITDGAFTAKLGTVTPPNPTTCKLSNIGSYDLSNGAKLSGITSFFNAQNQVVKTLLTDSTKQPVGIDYEFNFSYTASQINVAANQYFKLEPGGRIVEYHGNADPSVDTSLRVIVAYTYDASGYLATASLALEIFPTQPVLTYNYQWTGGNLTKVTMNFVTGEKTVIDYQYDAATPAKGFLAFHSNPEIILFQNAVNFGKNSANIPVKSTWTDYLANGTPDGTPYVSEFKNYVYDANGYVKSFDITGDGSVYGSDIRHVLSYKCF